jgi:hypothetical protein
MIKRGENNFILVAGKKRAQVTFFVIISLVLSFSIIFIFMVLKPELNFLNQKTSSPVEYISNCIEESIISQEKDFFKSSMPFGETSLLYKYNSKTIPFLCYSTEFYYPCIPQNPLFIEKVRSNMQNKVSRDLSRCILTLKEDYERKGYAFESSDFNLLLIFNELDISYSVKTFVKMTRGDEIVSISKIDGTVYTFLPKLLRTAETIVNYESVFCEFNHITWQGANRDVSISRSRGGDQTKVYSLKSRNSGNELNFAIRTCVLPAGL